MAEVKGSWDGRFDKVVEVLGQNIESRADVGASVVVMIDGEPMVDAWAGYKDAAKTAPWESDSIVNVWSTTKTMTFLCALMLVDRGELDFYAPVSKYWPEFAANGKESIEVRHLMSHTAGLSGWDEPLEVEDLADWEKCTSALAAQAPWWEPGTASGYHAVSQGFLIGEVVRRITGTTIGAWFKSEIADPLGADFHIGLPESEDSRVVPVIPPPIPDLSFLDPTSITRRTFGNPTLDAAAANNGWWRRAEIPAANGHGNARAVATVQSVIAGKGEARGVRLISDKTCDLIFDEQSNGPDLVLIVPIRFGMGYGLSGDLMPGGPRTCFWGGYGGSLIVMDQDLRLTVCYTMNRMDSGLTGDTRGGSIMLAAVACALGG
ncbi:MAG: serine hydrolase domain-containing protein [Acidimicrobiales bacterium]